jgi:hypothetical protein
LPIFGDFSTEKKVGRKKHLKVLVLALNAGNSSTNIKRVYGVCEKLPVRVKKHRLRRREAKPTNGFTERYQVLVATLEGYRLDFGNLKSWKSRNALVLDETDKCWI